MSEFNGLIDFKAVKKSVSMLRILEFYGLMPRLRRNGDSLSGPCPIHGGNTEGQFKVSISKNCWNCFGRCKSGGNALDFVSRKENIGIRDAAVFIMERFGLSEKSENDNLEKTEDESHPEEKIKQSNNLENDQRENKPLGFSLKFLDPSHPYLAERSLSQETITTFGLGYCKKGVLNGRIAVPIHNLKGELVAYVGRWPGDPPDGKDKYKFPEGFKKSLEMFNIHRALNEATEKPLIVVQSIFDCLKIWEIGFHRTVALMGNCLSEDQSALMLETVSSQGRIVLMFNEDETAQANCQNALVHLSPACYVKTVKFTQDLISQNKLSELLK